jgi:CheY-like chemotaxis protein
MGQSQPLKRWPVLVVEDEPILRLDAISMVEKAGFEAVEALSSADAIRLIEERLDIRLVYMDLDMPRSRKGCQSASKKDPLSACKRDPLRRAA